jgi:hypothetical protein
MENIVMCVCTYTHTLCAHSFSKLEPLKGKLDPVTNPFAQYNNTEL